MCRRGHLGFPENVSVTFYYWPIACTMYLEDLTAIVRGDNALLSHSFNGSQARNLLPFARALPSSPYERAWGQLFDAIWYNEMNVGGGIDTVYFPSYWLERQVMRLLNESTSTSSQEIAALEANLQSITSVAYSFLVQQLRIVKNLTSKAADVQGQQQTTLAKLHVNGLQATLGLLCVIMLFLCVLYAFRMGGGLGPREDRYIIVGDALNLMCLMRGSSLPRLLFQPKYGPSTPDARRDKAEKVDIV
jgi:hypothetical protein